MKISQTKGNFLAFLFFALISSPVLAEFNANDIGKFLEGGALLGIGIYSGAKAINYYYEIENKSDNLRESWFSTQEIKKDVKVLFGITLAYIMFKKAADILGVK
jgi:hypothetical protein